MPVTLEQIRERLENPVRKSEIALAKEHEEKIRFHTQTTVQNSYRGSAQTDYIDRFVRSKLTNKAKFHFYRDNFRFPVRTNETTERIYSKHERVFEGRNAIYDVRFVSPDLKDDWDEYRKTRLNEPKSWRETAFEIYKHQINSVVIVDLPAEQTGTLPEPYYYFLPIDQVVDYTDQKGELTEVIFHLSGDRLAHFDREAYTIFRVKENSRTDVTSIESQTPHDLGACPAFWFWGKDFSPKHPGYKIHPISNQLESLNWFLYFSDSKRALDCYAGYPITVVTERDCDYANDQTGDVCDGGYLRRGGIGGVYLLDHNQSPIKCPLCESQGLSGPGSTIEKPAPRDSSDRELQKPIEFVEPSRNLLDYNTEEESRLEAQIIASTTGWQGDPINDQAVNERQVMSLFETQKSILCNLAVQFERIFTWITHTVCRLRYGSGYIDTYISLGTEFYLFDAGVLWEMYAKARKEGASAFLLDMLQDDLFHTKYKNDPASLARWNTMKHLDPLRHLTAQQAESLLQRGVIDGRTALKKINLSSLISRFERENGDIVQFGDKIDFAKKIVRINETLNKYISEYATQEINTSE